MSRHLRGATALFTPDQGCANRSPSSSLVAGQTRLFSPRLHQSVLSLEDMTIDIGECRNELANT